MATVKRSAATVKGPRRDAREFCAETSAPAIAEALDKHMRALAITHPWPAIRAAALLNSKRYEAEIEIERCDRTREHLQSLVNDTDKVDQLTAIQTVFVLLADKKRQLRAFIRLEVARHQDNGRIAP